MNLIEGDDSRLLIGDLQEQLLIYQPYWRKREEKWGQVIVIE